MRRFLVTSFLLFVCLPGLLADDETSTDLLLILDASNSMWGQIDGVNKIVMARQSVGRLIDDLPDKTQVGLIAYGHRREGDCADIEILAEIAPVDKAALKTTVDGIRPKGKTPITLSIRAAVEMARQRESTAIVLVSDGLETCDLDPCAAVREARESGISFVLHVVGFDLAKEDTAQLECVAQEGGGLYLDASSAAELTDALASAYEKPTTPDGRLVVTATAEGNLQDALVSVIDGATGKDVASGRTYRASETNPRRIPLADGQYRAEVKAVGIKGSPAFQFEFEISGGSEVGRNFDFSAGELSVQVTRNGELSDAVVSVRVADQTKDVAGGRTYRAPKNNPKIISIAAGTYDVQLKSVEIRNGPEPLFEDVEVRGGERTEIDYSYASGTLRIGTRRGETLVDSVVTVLDADGKNIGGGRTYKSETSNPKEIVVAPGPYTIRVSEIRGDQRETTVTVTAGETTERIFDLDQP